MRRSADIAVGDAFRVKSELGMWRPRSGEIGYAMAIFKDGVALDFEDDTGFGLWRWNEIDLHMKLGHRVAQKEKP